MHNNQEINQRINGWAPGYYFCTCRDCETQFTGDKRAYQCYTCANKVIGLTGIASIEAESKDRLSAKDDYINKLLSRIRDLEFDLAKMSVLLHKP
jgi:hypothetical protein